MRQTRLGPGAFLYLAAAVIPLLLAFLTPWSASTVHAEDPLATKQLDVERQLGCPVCTNLPLNVCDNAICTQMKGVIHDQLAAGKTSDEVVAYFVSRYGEGVLLTPPRQGFNLAVWYLPFVAVLAGAAIVLAFVRRSVSRQAVVARRLARIDPGLADYRQRVRREVETLENSS